MNDHELQKKKDVYHMILPGIDVDTMFDNPSNKRVKKMAQLPPVARYREPLQHKQMQGELNQDPLCL